MPSKVANGNIKPSRFVKLSPTVAGRVTACTAITDPVYGVSGRGTRNAPYSTLDDGFHAIAGENCEVHMFPEQNVKLVVGTGGCAQGDRLSPAAGGTGEAVIAAATSVAAAIAEEPGVAGEEIRATLLSPAVL